jgi:hypothetical protein
MGSECCPSFLMVTPPAQPQVNIFTDSHQQTQFAEICNALYERELMTLAQQPFSNISLLQRKLGGLRHHIKRAAYHFIHHNGPLTVDVHNASWQAKQSASCIAKKHDPAKVSTWFSHYARSGLPVAIYSNNMNGEHLELDSIDRIDIDNQLLHSNKFGWFNMDGTRTSHETATHRPTSSNATQQLLLRPSRAVFSAACCGHTWNHKGRGQPRTLTLRELLLSGSINWKDFR